MRYFMIVLALAINVALVKSQGPAASGQTGGSSSDGANEDNTGDTAEGGSVNASASAGAGGQIGGCSVGASGSGSAGGVSGSADGSASENCATPGPGYTYVINATRRENVFPPGHPVAYMYYQVSPTQNLTYFTSVGPENPLLIEGLIYNDDKVYFSNDESHLLNSCDKQPDGTWQFVLIEIVKKSVLLGHGCSVKKGNYMIDQNVDPITVTLPEMIECGENDVIFNAYVGPSQEELSKQSTSKLTWAFQLYFTFQINNNCD